jgi:hypothetical protein
MWLFLAAAVVTLLISGTHGCVTAPSDAARGSLVVKPTDVPRSQLGTSGSVIAYRVEGHAAARYGQVRFPLASLAKNQRGDASFLVLVHSNGRYWPVAHRRDGEVLIADVTPGLVYVIARAPDFRVRTSLNLWCRVKVASEERGERRALLPKICTQIFCAPDVMSPAAFAREFGDWGFTPDGFPPGGIGGWRVSPPDLCATCTQQPPGPVGEPPAVTLECSPPPMQACTAGVALFSDNFEADTIGAQPRTSPAGLPTDDSVSVAGDIVVVSALTGKAARVTRAVVESHLDAVVGSGASPHGSYCVSFQGLAAGDVSATLSLLSSGGQPAWRLQTGPGGSSLVSGGPPVSLSAFLPAGTPHRLQFASDLDAARFNLAINGETVATSLPFLDAGFTAPARLRFEYIPMIVEGFPGNYTVDDIQIRKTN